MRTGVMGIFVCYAIGIAAVYKAGVVPAFVLMLVALAIAAVTGIFYCKGRVMLILMVISAMCGAAAYTAADYATDEYNGEYVTLVGRICELPYTYDDERYYYVLKPHSIIYMNKSEKFGKRVRICSDKIYEYGDCIAVSGFIDKFPSRKNDTDFNSAVYHKEHGIFYKMTDIYSEYSEKYRVISARDMLLSIHNAFAKYISAHYKGKPRAYLEAIIIGNMRNFGDELHDVMIYSGARRYLYSSFIHTSITVFVLSAVFWVFKTKKYTRDGITAAVLLVYASVMSTHPVFIKSMMSAAFILLYKKKFGYVQSSDALAVSGAAVLLSNPFFAFDVGFLVTMTSGALNIMFCDKLGDIFSVLRGYRYSFSRWVISMLGVVPLYAACFGGMSVYTPVTQLFAIPLAIVIIVLFPISMAQVCIFGTTTVADSLLSAAMLAFDTVAETIARLPFSYVFIPEPTPYQITLFYGILAAVYVGFTERRKPKRILLPTAVSVIAAVIVTVGYIDDIGKLRIMFCNVGQGDAAVVSVNYREKLLIDGGGSETYSNFDIGRHIYVPFLRNKGIYRANAIVTHYHKDHCQGILSALDGIRINTLFMPDIEPDNEFRIRLEQKARENGTAVVYVKCGDKIEYRSGLTVEFVSPDDEDIKNADMNGASLVAYVSYGEFSALFTGDMTEENEMKIIKKGLARECDVLKVAHHGSATSNSAEFISAVAPKTAVISVGEDNVYALPDENVLKRLAGIDVLRTDESGNITITADKNGVYTTQRYKN